VESLVAHVKASGVYESISIYSKVKQPEVARHELALEETQLAVMCGLPLRWVVDILRGALRFGLNQALVAHVVQAYIDRNTHLNRLQGEEESRETGSHVNLVSMASDILNSADKTEADNHLNLVKMAGDILKFADKAEEAEEEKSTSLNLIKMAGDILKAGSRMSGVEEARPTENSYGNNSADEEEVDEDEASRGNLKSIMSAVLLLGGEGN